jgi:hypothetical protein
MGTQEEEHALDMINVPGYFRSKTEARSFLTQMQEKHRDWPEHFCHEIVLKDL